MKKITFNALLNHKAHNYKPMQIEVEKVIPLYGKRFEQMRDACNENHYKTCRNHQNSGKSACGIACRCVGSIGDSFLWIIVLDIPKKIYSHT